MQAFTVLYKKKNLINLWKNLKKRKIHFNYLPVKFNDRFLPNNVHEILNETRFGLGKNLIQ